MKKKYFGTDGVRGIANEYPIIPSFLKKLAFAIFKYKKKELRKIIIGKDTRISGSMIEKALVDAFLILGVDCTSIGVVSTPILAFSTKKYKYDLGIMISASHNEYKDNGIKIFNNCGEKLSDEDELLIEKYLDANLNNSMKKGIFVEKKIKLDDYESFLFDKLPTKLDLKKIKIFMDCANGSLSYIAPNFFKNLGANVIEYASNPNGTNINKDCGAMYPEKLSKLTKLNHADVGLAFDGDADRVLVSDEKGQILNGDDILLSIATHLNFCKLLKGNCVVSTVMSNLGFRDYLKNIGVKLYLTSVGDRYVIEKMKEIDASLGGEQSGHIIFSENGFSGDGILTALFLLCIIEQKKFKMSEISSQFKKTPQKLINFKLKNAAEKIIENEILQKRIKKFKENDKFITDILLRKSGTENLLRFMVQCNNKDQLDLIIKDVKKTIEKIDDY